MWDFAEIGHKFWNTLSYKLGRMGERNLRRNAETLLTAWNGFWSAGHLAALLSEHVGRAQSDLGRGEGPASDRPDGQVGRPRLSGRP